MIRVSHRLISVAVGPRSRCSRIRHHKCIHVLLRPVRRLLRDALYRAAITSDNGGCSGTARAAGGSCGRADGPGPSCDEPPSESVADRDQPESTLGRGTWTRDKLDAARPEEVNVHPHEVTPRAGRHSHESPDEVEARADASSAASARADGRGARAGPAGDGRP